MPKAQSVPPLTQLDDLWSKDDVAAYFGVGGAAIDNWRYGYDRKAPDGEWPLLPYVRIGHAIYFCKNQVVWWINQLQEMRDSHHETVVRRRLDKAGKDK